MLVTQLSVEVADQVGVPCGVAVGWFRRRNAVRAGRQPRPFHNDQNRDQTSPLLGGREVDLRAAANLGRYFRDEAVKTAEVQYGVR
jgi:hypothetical protein